MFANILRCYCFATIAIVATTSVLLADPPKSPRPSAAAEELYLPKQIDAAASPIDGAIDTDQYSSPCEKGQDKRYSDLCAQWKAADAAAEAAKWSYGQIWIGGVGLILGIITMGAAVAAAIFAKRAAEHTKTGAEAAIASANAATIANDRSEMRFIAENRPWLRIEGKPDVLVSWQQEELLNCEAQVTVKNVGKVAAFGVEAYMKLVPSAFTYAKSALVGDFAKQFTDAEIVGDWGNTIIFPDTDEPITAFTEDYPAIPKDHKYVIVLICVVYRVLGHQGVFHAATAVRIHVSEFAKRPAVKPGVLYRGIVQTHQIKGCNSVG